MLIALLLSAFSPAGAGTLAGVTLPDTAEVGGQSLVLNGMGLREKFFIDVYVGGLYLPAKTGDAEAAIQQDVPKRVVMHFIYDDVPAEKMAATFYEGLEHYPQYAGERASLDQIVAGIPDMSTGDEIVLDYIPGTGTVLTVNGAARPAIAGKGLSDLLFSLFIGPKPATEALKEGMMGG